MMRLVATLSVIWLLGFAAFALFGSVRELHKEYDHYIENCSSILDKDPDQTRRYEYCRSDANEFYFDRLDDYKKQIPWFLIQDFGILVVGWTVVLLGIATVRGAKWAVSMLPIKSVSGHSPPPLLPPAGPLSPDADIQSEVELHAADTPPTAHRTQLAGRVQASEGPS